MSSPIALRVGVLRHDASPCSREEEVVVEEPLEIRVAGEALAITMRTPGDDRALVLGFLFAEGVIQSLADVGSVHPCGRLGEPRYGNAIEVTPGPGVNLDVERLELTRRVGLITSACGVCGRDAIDDLLARATPIRDGTPLDPATISRIPDTLRAHQPLFARTGGLHAACALTCDGRVLESAEDVGRHNAVDKVVGKLLLASKLPARTPSEAPRVLAVSGRASFEIVQKAAVAGFVCVASISAPSSLAIDTADALGITLIGFVREGRLSIYTHSQRLV